MEETDYSRLYYSTRDYVPVRTNCRLTYHLPYLETSEHYPYRPTRMVSRYVSMVPHVNDSSYGIIAKVSRESRKSCEVDEREHNMEREALEQQSPIINLHYEVFLVAPVHTVELPSRLKLGFHRV
jgi:hypothetical protein